GKGDFGISFQEDVTYALTMEDPLPIKAIAAIIQHNTSGFGSYVGKNIKSPADFEGKTYSGWGSPAEEAILKTLMEKDGGDFSKLNIIVADNMDYSMLKEDIDVRWIYWAWDGIAAERIGIDLNYMEIRDFDERLDYYTPVIVANTKTLEERPEMVKAFLAATSKGYTYAVENPDDAAEILYEAVGTYDLDMLKESQAYLADKYMEDVEQWGIMKDSVWNRYTDFMVENGLIENAIPADKCYTNEFLPEK
ncbi:MAG: ABC transporter substrate-binding protein, partial [Anaerovoracaceae bacterium]